MSNLNLPDEYLGAWCEVKSADDELLAVGNIITLESKFITITDNENTMKEIEPGTLVKFGVFYPEKEICICTGNVYTSDTSEISVVNIICLTDIEEKSECFRTESNIEAFAVYRANEKDWYPTETEITVKKVSFEGLSFSCEKNLAVNTMVGIKLKLNDDEEIMINCEIISTEGESAGRYECSYISDEKTDITENIITLIIKSQRDYLRNNR